MFHLPLSTHVPKGTSVSPGRKPLNYCDAVSNPSNKPPIHRSSRSQQPQPVVAPSSGGSGGSRGGGREGAPNDQVAGPRQAYRHQGPSYFSAVY
eukprot:TRINITY_DN8617_c0_g1_i1.p1 TRINITY_DN8617_c0_g1~~TRINITY_DN8617_c0_g1_i1.p1  ORF type:complete len:94 (-),score=5.61 TRINITY_DN8617_c0_g1_i1:123-404(-)